MRPTTPMFLSAALGGLLLAGPAWAAAAAGPKASSEATDDDGTKHLAAHAFDGLLSTAWAEGASGDGAGSTLELRFDRPVDVASISIWPGMLSGSNREIREYGRPKLVTIELQLASGDPITKQERLLDPGETGPFRHDVMLEGKQVRAVVLKVDEALAGGLHSDMYIAEVGINFVSGTPDAKAVEVATWLASEAGQAAAEAHRVQAVAMFDQISGSDFGNRDALKSLMEWTVDGAPYLREKVAKTGVPHGFRVPSIQPDKTSIEALLKLKDSNAIPAIERAALRVSGALADDLRRRAKLFDAYNDLLGAKSRTAGPWGQEGIAQGMLRSLGEPLDIAVDEYGHIYVADVANNRVQRFGIETGVVNEVFGAEEPGVTEAWFVRGREAYASGSMPGEADGEFTYPVDLAVMPGKNGDSLLVLDARGRVTLIDPDGKVERVVKVPAEVGISPGVGGEGHVVSGKSGVVVIWGNEGFLYDTKTWADPVKFAIEDGVPTSAVMFPNGKLGMVFGKRLVLYAADGFRFGDLLGDTLGGGFQDWAVTLDQDGKLWAILDTGTVVKYKKPGKVDYSASIGEYSFEVPRMAVFDDVVFVTERNHILRVDALDALAKQEAGVPGSGTLNIPDDE